MVNTPTVRAGTRINHMAKSWKNNPPTEIIPAILKSIPSIARVLFQTVLLISVQVVRIPTNQFCSACSRRKTDIDEDHPLEHWVSDQPEPHLPSFIRHIVDLDGRR
jgi:hypothetical protein